MFFNGRKALKLFKFFHLYYSYFNISINNDNGHFCLSSHFIMPIERFADPRKLHGFGRKFDNAESKMAIDVDLIATAHNQYGGRKG